MPQRKSAFCTRHIFPFLDLPYELQTLIYRKYYEGPEITLELENVNDNLTWQYHRELIFRGIPSSKIELLNHQIRKDATRHKDTYLTRTLKIERTKTLPRIIERLLSDPQYRWICGHIEDIFLSTNQLQISWPIDWSLFLQAFPNVKRMYLKRLLSGTWTFAYSYEKAVREFVEGFYASKMIAIMTREFRLKPLIEALDSVGREVCIRVWFYWGRRAIDTNESFRVVSRSRACNPAAPC